jgi:hypothetical protein
MQRENKKKQIFAARPHHVDSAPPLGRNIYLHISVSVTNPSAKKSIYKTLKHKLLVAASLKVNKKALCLHINQLIKSILEKPVGFSQGSNTMISNT